jgi:hypothetical protein
MYFNLRPLTAKRPTSALFVILSALITFCRSCYAFQPLLPLTVNSLRSDYLAIFATTTRLENNITEANLALINNEVGDAYYQDLVDFYQEHGHVYVQIETSVAQEDYRNLVYIYFSNIC